jgi:subtilisin-like proprotein convertase family protein
MAQIQRIFPSLTANALSFLRHPTGGLGDWDQVSTVYSGAGSRYVGPAQGAVQQQAVPRFNAIPNGATHALLLAQFLSDPLRQTSIPADSWNVAFAAALSNAGASYTWEGRAALFVLNGSTGQRRATIFDATTIGSTGRTATAERSCLDSISGQAAQVRAGDCLCLELGIAVSNAAAALAPQASLFAQGTTPITSDNAAISSAQTVLESPVPLLLTLPQAGEPPRQSVTLADAVRILKEAFPPRSGSLYDWDSDDAKVAKIMQALGAVMKLYAFDQSDRVFRETNPLTFVELLPVWEALLGITLSEAALRSRSAEQRRQTVLARLREMGPLTLHNLAAIFAQLAGYVAPAAPEVLEFQRGDMEPPNTYADPISAAIPTGTTFDGTNLIRITPTLLDGGVVQDAGVLVTLNLSAAQSENLHVRLSGPSFVSAEWGGGPNLATAVKLRSPAHAGGPVHGNWTLSIYRDVGSPAVTLNSWSLYVLGKRWGGRSGAKHIWSVYLDAAHQVVDRRDIDTTLDRITQSYAEGFVIFDRTSIPGTNTHRAGRFIPGT